MSDSNRSDSGDAEDEPTAAETMLRSLRSHGIERVFANFGTDHTPLLEAAAQVCTREGADLMPSFVVCPTNSSR